MPSSRPAAVRRRVVPIGVGLALVAIVAGRVALRSTPEPAVAAVTPAAAEDTFGACAVERIIDGDTLDVRCNGTRDRVRLLRIDTPERGDPGYREAGAALRDLVGAGELRLEFETPGVPERGRYGRLLAYVFADGTHVNVEMVRAGWSPFWTRYGTGRYAADFERAERESSGGLSIPVADDCIPRAQCCKVCSRGQACGDSCIARSSTCRKGQGCACNVSEVCS